MSHANARLTVHGRMLVVRRVRLEGRPKAHVAKELGVSRQCVHRWVARFDAEGWDRLQERSSRPHTSPTRTSPEREAEVLTARREHRCGPAGLAVLTGVPERTVTRVLRRHLVAHWSAGSSSDYRRTRALSTCCFASCPVIASVCRNHDCVVSDPSTPAAPRASNTAGAANACACAVFNQPEQAFELFGHGGVREVPEHHHRTSRTHVRRDHRGIEVHVNGPPPEPGPRLGRSSTPADCSRHRRQAQQQRLTPSQPKRPTRTMPAQRATPRHRPAGARDRRPVAHNSSG